MCVLETFSEEARSKQQEELLSAGDKLTTRRSQRLVRALGCSLSVSFLFLILPFGLLRGSSWIIAPPGRIRRRVPEEMLIQDAVVATDCPNIGLAHLLVSEKWCKAGYSTT